MEYGYFGNSWRNGGWGFNNFCGCSNNCCNSCGFSRCSNFSCTNCGCQWGQNTFGRYGFI